MIFFGFGAFFFAMMVREFVRGWSMQHWPTTNCTILASTAEPEGSGYAAKVRYRYDFAGKPHTSNQYRRGYTGSNDYASAEKVAKKYAAHTNHVCHVNPANPDDAVLDVQTGWMWLAMLWLPLLFIGIGGGGIYFMWFPLRRTKPVSDRGQPISERAVTSSGMRIGVGICALFFIGGAIATFAWTVPTLHKIVASGNWPATPCKVLSSRVQAHDSDDGTTYSVDILYTYKVKGHDYTSSRYEFIGGSSSGRSGKQLVVAQYPKGKTATCYVNPADPGEAVLAPGWSWTALLFLIPTAFLLGGGGGLIGIYRSNRRKKSGENMWALRRAAPTSIVSTTHASVTPMPSVLKPAQTARSKFLGLLVFTAIWDGGMAIFLYNWIKGGAHFELCGGLFASIFVLLGVLVFGGLIYSFLALVNPTAELELSPSVLVLGGHVTIRWKLSGRTDRVSKLSIRVEGREEATYRRGTRTYTDKNVFQIIQVTETTKPIEIARGEARFQIPAGTMHSFASGNNKVVWEIKLRGEIARWPDVITEYPLQVQPLEIGT